MSYRVVTHTNEVLVVSADSYEYAPERASHVFRSGEEIVGTFVGVNSVVKVESASVEENEASPE